MAEESMDRDGRGTEFTTFQIPGRLVEVGAILLSVVVVLHTLWSVATAGGPFGAVPEPMRGVVAVCIGYLAVRILQAGVRSRGKPDRRRLGPDLERIEPS